MNVDQLIEPQWLPILHKAFDHGVVETFEAKLRIRMPEFTEVFDSRLFHVQQVPTVVDDSHRVGFGKSNPDAMVERIRRRVERRLN